MKKHSAALFIISLFTMGLLISMDRETNQETKRTIPSAPPVVEKTEQTEREKDQVPPFCSCQDEERSVILSLGDSGPAVENLQKSLSSLGYTPGVIDGKFGPKTLAALNLFQKEHSLPVIERAGIEIWEALREQESEMVSTKKPPPEGEVTLLIELNRLKLTVFADGKPYHEFLVAIGKSDTPSPVGDWEITEKGSWGGGFGTRWMGLNVPWGRYGIHGTNKPGSIGSASSHGCFRMWNRDVEVLYEWVKKGTKVKVVHGSFDPLGPQRRRLHLGVRGSDVYIVQRRLKQLGILEKGIDGIYGSATIKAVKEFQRQHKLHPHGEVDMATYQALGFINFE